MKLCFVDTTKKCRRPNPFVVETLLQETGQHQLKLVGFARGRGDDENDRINDDAGVTTQGEQMETQELRDGKGQDGQGG